MEKEKEPRKSSARHTGTITKDASYYKIYDSVRNWRKTTIPLWDPEMPTTGMGAQTFMPPSIIARVTDLAAAGMVDSPKSLMADSDVDWYYISTYAGSLFSLISEIAPKAPSAPAQANENSASLTPTGAASIQCLPEREP